MQRTLMGLFIIVIVMSVSSVLAQDTSLPPAYTLSGFNYEPQGWNNCGPATLTNGLTFFGYGDSQARAANWLKPNYEDKNVSPWQMMEFVNTQIPEIPVYSLVRSGGTLEQLKLLLANNFPVIIEAGYDPDPDRLGWMGHYLLLLGYDDNQQIFMTHDSYLEDGGPNTPYSYEHITTFWRQFNHVYLVLYESGREPELLELLGSDADVWQNAINALEQVREDAIANPDDPFAWFNMGTNFVALNMVEEAAIAYDQARNVGGGLPWRMLWYQFGPYEAYNAVGRYDDVITLAQAVLNDGGGQYVEETFYYAGIAREGKQEIERAVNNFNEVLAFNPNFSPARAARDRLQGGG
jgi:tetratricopeptide (TPR) repeat protein